MKPDPGHGYAAAQPAGEERREAKNRFGRAMSGAALVYGGGAALAVLSQVVLARIMGATDYGIYYYVISWSIILALLVRMGLDYATMRFLPVFIHDRDWPAAKGILSLGGRIAVVNGLLIAALLFGVVRLLGDRLDGAMGDTFLMAAPCLVLFGLVYLRQAVLRSLGQVVRSLLPDGIIAPLLLIALAALSQLLGYPLSAPAAMGLTLLSFALSLLVGVYWQFAALPAAVRSARPRFETRLWIGIALSMLMINGMHVVLLHVDAIILGLFRTPDEVGVFGVASRIAVIAAFPLTIANAVFTPLIARYYFSGRKQELQRTLVLGMRPVAVISLALLMTVLLLAAWLMSLFGDEFTRGGAALKLLVSAQCINALCGPVGLLLALCGLERIVARVMVASVLLSIALNFALIPVWGMMGAAMATACCIIFWNVTLYLQVRRRLALDASGWLALREEKAL